MSIFRNDNENARSHISLEEFKWNLKRLLHECYPDGIFLHDIEEAYYHWFRKMVSPSAFLNHFPLEQQNDNNHKSSNWIAVFKTHSQLRQAFIVETIEEDICKVRLRPGCIKPEENKIILALTEYSNCTAYMRGHFSQNRTNEETEPSFPQIINFSWSSSSINPCDTDGTRRFVDASVQAEEPENNQDPRPLLSPTKMETNELTMSSTAIPLEITVKTDRVVPTSVSREFSELCNGSNSHISNYDDDEVEPKPDANATKNTNLETDVSAEKPAEAEASTILTNQTSFPLPENQETLSTAFPHEHSDTGENEEISIENNLELNGIQNEEGDPGLVVQNGNLEVSIQDSKTETSDQFSKTPNETCTIGFKCLLNCNENDQKDVEHINKKDSTNREEKKVVIDATPTIPFKDILVSTPLRKVAATFEQTKHRCTYLGCSKTFDSLKERQRHLIEAHALNGLKFKCQVDGCKKLFRTEGAMLQHSAECSRPSREPSPSEGAEIANGTGTCSSSFSSINCSRNPKHDHAPSVFGVRYVEPEDEDEHQCNADASSSSSKRRRLGFPKRCYFCDTIIESSLAMNLHLLKDHN